MARGTGTTGSSDRREVIEVVIATPTRRVEKAFDTELRHVVAVVSEPLGGRDPDTLLARLTPFVRLPRSRAIAPLIDVYVEGDRIVLVSLWVEGADLLTLLVASGTPGLPVTAVLAWLDQVGEAVRHLQASGLVHEDIRPANLVLSADQSVVVIGLGTGILASDSIPDPNADVRGVAATAAALLTGSSPSVGAISGTANVSAAALQRALLPALDPTTGVQPSLDELLRTLRRELNAALPTGVITFLLTDIVGSTAQWEADATVMSVQLAHHDLLMAECVERAGGRFIKARGEGDATFSVFTRASEAVSAAIEAHRRLRAETQIVVRMSIHTGEAELREADYFGRTVNRAARLRSVAPDGGVLLSSASADLVRDHLPDGVRLVDMGETQLKDLDRAERTYRLDSDVLVDVHPVQLPDGGGLTSLPRFTEPPAVDDRVDGLPAPPEIPTPPRPTVESGRSRRGLLIGVPVAVVAAIVAGVLVLGGGDDAKNGDLATGSTTTSSLPEKIGVPEEGALADALVPLADLGGTFTRIEPLAFGDGAEPCGQENIDVQVPPAEIVGTLAQDAAGSTSVTQGLRRYRNDGQAAEAFDLTRASLACAAARVFTEAGEPVDGAVGPADDVVVVDGRPGFVTDLTFGEFVVTIAVARVDDVVVVVQFGAYPDGVNEARALTTQLLALAVTRIIG